MTSQVHPGRSASTSTSTSVSPAVLLGRGDEQEFLAELVRGARQGRAGAVVLRGEAGIGESVLLDDLAARAHGFCICRATGVESEMELAHAGLQQLCTPMLGRLADLSAFHRNLLEKAFGYTTGTPPERFQVGMGALDLVARTAEDQPLTVAGRIGVVARSGRPGPHDLALGTVTARIWALRVPSAIVARAGTTDRDDAGWSGMS